MEVVAVGLVVKAATTVATVTQLALYAQGLVAMIKKAAKTAQQNKPECEHLARRVSLIGLALPRLQLQDPEVAQPLAGLRDTLQEAHDLVVACQKWSARKKFLYAGVQANKFSELNRRIDSHLILIPLFSHISISRRLDQLVIPPVVAPPTVPAPAPGSSSGSSSGSGSDSGFGSRQLQESAMLDYVSSTPSTHVAVEFTSAEIAFLTEHFSHVLTEDGSVTVYKGRLHDGPEVAIKCLKNYGQQYDEQEGAFVAELDILSRLRHDHVVRLVGWCAEEDERILVYQYQDTSNGTLRDHLHGGTGGGSASPVTSSWMVRIQALLGSSRAMDHLHRGAAVRIIHRNVSSSSILLDESWEPRVSGFGGAILQVAPMGEEHGQVVAEVVGKLGYIDPEYRRTRHVSPASDVYSFGVVTLEVLTGRLPSWEGEDQKTLVDFAVPIIERGDLWFVLDRRPSPEPTPGQMEALKLVACTAVRCLWPQDRPAMSDVVTNLETALNWLTDSDELC